eukprot:3937075-Rhodomonas_salina.2
MQAACDGAAEHDTAHAAAPDSGLLTHRNVHHAAIDVLDHLPKRGGGQSREGRGDRKKEEAWRMKEGLGQGERSDDKTERFSRTPCTL